MAKQISGTGRVAAIYARVSSSHQREEQTIQSQTAELRELAAERGLLVPDELVFEDDGVSGATLTRPALERLRDRACDGSFEVLLCHSRTGWRAVTPTRCCCWRSSSAPAWRSVSLRSPSARGPPRTSCCASSRE